MIGKNELKQAAEDCGLDLSYPTMSTDQRIAFIHAVAMSKIAQHLETIADEMDGVSAAARKIGDQP